MRAQPLDPRWASSQIAFTSASSASRRIRQLLHQEPHAPLPISGKQHARRQLLRRREIRLERIGEGRPGQGHDSLITGVLLFRLDGDNDPPLVPHQSPKAEPPCDSVSTP